MLDAPGVGLAAPQIGVVAAGLHLPRRRRALGHLVNPTLDLSDEEQDGEEGCLSVPGLAFDCTPRAARGRQGLRTCTASRSSLEGTELLARCVQHETDHLDGVLFVDRLDKETRKVAMKAIREAEWFGETGADGQGQPARHLRHGALGRRAPGLRRHAGGRRAVARGAARRRRHEVVAVVTRPDAAGRSRPRGRPSPVGRVGPRSRRRGADSRVAARPRVPGPAAPRWPRTAARSSRTARWSRRPRSTVPPHGWVNLHFSLLPAWRGAAPVQHAVLAGDDVTGATTFRLEEGLDTGPVYGVLTEPIGPADTAGDLLGRLAEVGRAAARRDPRRHRGRHAGGGARNRPTASRSRPRSPPDDARVDWTAPALRRRPAGPGARRRPRAPGRPCADERLKLGPVPPGAGRRGRRPAGARRAARRPAGRRSSAPAAGAGAAGRGPAAGQASRWPAADWARGAAARLPGERFDA